MNPLILTILPVVLMTLSGCKPPPAESTDETPLPADLQTSVTDSSEEGNSRRYGSWTSSILGGGGYITQLDQSTSHPDKFLAVCDVGGLYLSENNGKRWRMIHEDWPDEEGINDCAAASFDPANSEIILAAVGSVWFSPHGILRTADGGRTWTKTLDARFYGNGEHRSAGRVLVRQPTNENVVAAGSGGDGLFWSEDGGVTWELRGLNGINIIDVAFDPSSPSRLWVCAQANKPYNSEIEFQGGFFRSDDAGRTWTKLAEQSPSEVAVHPQGEALIGIFDNATIRISHDRGATWTEFRDGLNYNPKEAASGEANRSRYQAIATGPDFWLTSCTNGFFYRRAFDAEAWTPVKRKNVEAIHEGQPWWAARKDKITWWFGSSLATILVDRRDPERWMFSDWFGIHSSSDGGKNWRLTNDGTETTCLHALVQDPVRHDLVHGCFWDIGYVFSPNSGERYHLGKAGIVTSNFKSVVVSPTDPTHMYATGDGHEGAAWQANSFWRSFDGGDSWSRIRMPEGLPPVDSGFRFCSIEIDPNNALRVYVAASGPVAEGAGGFYVSTDGGSTWTWESAGIDAPDAFFRSGIAHMGPEIAVQTDGTAMATSYDTHRIFRRAPGGIWQEVKLNIGEGKPRSIVAQWLSPGVFFMSVEDDGIWKSTDSGETWERVWTGNAGRIIVDRGNPARVAAGTRDDIILSVDGGETWSSQGSDLPIRWFPIPGFAGNNLLAGTTGGGAFWKPIANPWSEKTRLAAELRCRTLRRPISHKLRCETPHVWI